MFTRQELAKHYDGLSKKDMPKEQFIRQAQELTDLAKMRRDAGLMLQGKKKEQSPIITL